jgi:hypothetical protein
VTVDEGGRATTPSASGDGRLGRTAKAMSGKLTGMRQRNGVVVETPT